VRSDGHLEGIHEKPFVVSKGQLPHEKVYGTVCNLLRKVDEQVRRLQNLQLRAEATLDALGIKVDPSNPILPESPETRQILNDQEAVIEDVLTVVSVHMRILSEVFPSQLQRAKVPVYDYDGNRVGAVKLADISNILVHNRYICVRDQFIVDLFSSDEFLSSHPQMGLKIDFLEYLHVVEAVIYGLTVKDLISKLWGMVKELSVSSSIRDIVYLHQNLYTLGGVVLGSETAPGGPLEKILNRVAERYLAKNHPNPPPGLSFQMALTMSSPHFGWHPDLNDKKIRTHITVNGESQKLDMDYEEFFRELLSAYGDTKLLGQK